MELTLTPSRESAITKEHGSLDFLQAYVDQYADYLISKQAETDRMTKIKVLQDLPKAEFEAIVDPIIAAKAEEVAVEAPK